MSEEKKVEPFAFLSNDTKKDEPFSFLSNDTKKDDNAFSFLSNTSSEPGTFSFSFNQDQKKDDEDEEGEGGDNVAPEEECKAKFEPLVKLEDLPEIQIKTNEEEEDIFYSCRAKLFRFVAETNEWKERGFGLLKILKHKKTGKIRVLMRRDNILKICANHYLTTAMKLEQNVGSDKSWVYSVGADFSEEGTQSTETFAVRLGNVEAAKEFKVKFEEAQKEVAKLEEKK